MLTVWQSISLLWNAPNQLKLIITGSEIALNIANIGGAISYSAKFFFPGPVCPSVCTPLRIIFVNQITRYNKQRQYLHFSKIYQPIQTPKKQKQLLCQLSPQFQPLSDHAVRSQCQFCIDRLIACPGLIFNAGVKAVKR